jgi:uncharacterized protein (DUF362 family)
MSRISRREFLLTVLAGMSGLAADQLLTACSPKATPVIQQATSSQPKPTLARPVDSQPTTAVATKPASPTTNTQPEASPTTSQSTATQTPAPIPDLVVARNGEPEAMVRQVMAALGGMERFVSKGANVIVKPNICVAYHTYEYAATTNPWVVGALVKMCFEAGAASVRVMDYPFGGTAKEAYVKSGIEEQVKAAGGEMASMPGFKYVSTDIPDGKSLHKVDVFGDILKADTLINVPIAKTHSLARLTLGMKNLMGVIRDRGAIHQNLGQRLADLNSRLRPTLTVVDAVRVLMANGPTGGNLDDVQQMNTVIAGTDVVAADSYGTTLFGMKPDDIPYIQAGAAMGLGRSDLNNLHIQEINLAS